VKENKCNNQQMILIDPRLRAQPTGLGERASLDELLRRAAALRPHGLALLDPPDRERFTDGAPRHLTYAQADRAVSAIAGRLRRIGLQTDAIVAMQMANTVENVLTFLGILRAGLIAMPLPLLWRRADAVAALRRVGATALIVSGRIGAADHFALAREIAAEIFPIRYVCGYGREPPDGLVPSMTFLYSAKSIPSRHGKRSEDGILVLAPTLQSSRGM
jgi:non-ribosomal peptide synthetase component E (peptide arylation enzyme)